MILTVTTTKRKDEEITDVIVKPLIPPRTDLEKRIAKAVIDLVSYEATKSPQVVSHQLN